MKQDVTDIHVHPHNMPCHTTGVSGFYWPISYKERKVFCDELIVQYIKLIRQFSDSTNDLLSYKVLGKNFITEVLAVVNAEALKYEINSQYRITDTDDSYRIWHALLNNSVPEDPAFLIKLKSGPRVSNSQRNIKYFWTKIKRVVSVLNLKKGGIELGNLKIKPISEPVIRTSIIATQRTELIQRHAALTSKDVIFCRSDRWFSSLDEQMIKDECAHATREFEAACLAYVSDYCKGVGFTLSNNAYNYLQHILTIGAACIRLHYRRLLTQEWRPSLPVQLWTGSGGNIWDLMFRLAVLKQSGYVIGHDHGAGLAHVNNPVMGFIEFWGCSEFVCLNRNQAKEFRQQIETWPAMEETWPNIRGLDIEAGASSYQEYQKFKLPSTHTPKHIILLATVYSKDRVWMGPCSPDIVHVDWQVRAVRYLIEQGYEVTVKVHPETPIMPPETLKQLGANIRKERLEDIMEEGDVIVFDCVYTSVFRSVLSTNIPMVLFDFYQHPWTEGALEKLKKRVSFIDSGFDNSNRKKVDWSQLNAAIQDSVNKNNNTEFYDYYYK